MLRPALALFAWLSVLTGLAYPLLTTGVAWLVFPEQAGGGIVYRGGKPAGSRLIGQNFSDPGHFWGRLSATSPMPYNGAGSGGSNLSATNPALVDQARARIDALRAADPDLPSVPALLATASGSGLDPDIDPAAALAQVGRVARVRGIDPARLRLLVAAHTREPTLGVLGGPRINVLELNLELDAMTP